MGLRLAGTLLLLPLAPPVERAIGLSLPSRGCAQVSTNIHDFRVVSPAEVLESVRQRVPVKGIEFVGLPPQAALDGLDAGHVRSIEEALRSNTSHGPDQEEAPA